MFAAKEDFDLSTRPCYLEMTRERRPNLDLSHRPRLQDLTRVVGELGPGDEDDVPDSSGWRSHLFLLAPLPIPSRDEEGCVEVEDDAEGWCGIGNYRTTREITV